MRLVDLTTLRATSLAAGRTYTPGEIAACKDATYGLLMAIYCYIQDAVTVLGGPAYPDITAGWVAGGVYTVDEDENESGVIGQEFCIGSFMESAVVAAAHYGWVQIYGNNTLALTTDGTVDAGYTIIGTATDGTWGGISEAVGRGKSVGVGLAADSSTTSAVNTVMFNSILAGAGETLGG
jgi:hypothetical protein